MIFSTTNLAVSLAVALVLITGSGCQQEPTTVTNGELLTAANEELTIRGPLGGDIKSFEVAPHAEITLNGHQAELRDLNQNQRVNVILKHEGASMTVTDVVATTEALRGSVTDAALPSKNREASTPPPSAESDSQRRVEEAQGAKATFEGEILEFGEQGFFLRVKDEKRFVRIPDEVRVVVLDDRSSQIGQIATVIAEKRGGEYVARAIVVRPR